jgi:hypothetical protein
VRASSGGSSPRAPQQQQQRHPAAGQQRGGFGSTFVPAATSINAEPPGGGDTATSAAGGGAVVLQHQAGSGRGRWAIELQLQGAAGQPAGPQPAPPAAAAGAASLSASGGAVLAQLPGVGRCSVSSDGDDSSGSDSDGEVPAAGTVLPRRGGAAATAAALAAAGGVLPRPSPHHMGSALAAALGLEQQAEVAASSTSSWPVLAPGSMANLAGLGAAAAAEGQPEVQGIDRATATGVDMTAEAAGTVGVNHGAANSSSRRRWGEADGCSHMDSHLQQTQQQQQQPTQGVARDACLPSPRGMSQVGAGLAAGSSSSAMPIAGVDLDPLGPGPLTTSTSSCVSGATLGTQVTSSSLAGMDLLPQLTSRSTLYGGGEGRAASRGGGQQQQQQQQQRPPQVPRLALGQVLGVTGSAPGQAPAMPGTSFHHQQQQQQQVVGTRPSPRGLDRQQQQQQQQVVVAPSSVASSTGGGGEDPHRQSNNSTTSSSGRGGPFHPGTHSLHQQQRQAYSQPCTAPSSGAATPRGGVPGTTWGSSRSSTGLGSAPGLASARSLRPEGSGLTTAGAAAAAGGGGAAGAPPSARHHHQLQQQQERPLTGGSARGRSATPRSILVLTPRGAAAAAAGREDSSIVGVGVGLGAPLASRPPSLTPRAAGAGYMASRPAHLYASTSTAYAMYSPLSRGLGALGPRGGGGEGAQGNNATSSSSLAPQHPQAAAGGLGRPSTGGALVGQVPSSWSVDVPPSPGLMQQQQGGQRGSIAVNSSLTGSTSQGLQRGRSEVLGLAPTGVMPPPAAAARAAASAADTVEAVVQLVMGGSSGRLLPAPASLTPRRAAAAAATPGAGGTPRGAGAAGVPGTGAQQQRHEAAARGTWAAPQQQQVVSPVGPGVSMRREAAAAYHQLVTTSSSSSPQRRPRGDWQHPVVLEGEGSRGVVRGAGVGSGAAVASSASGWVGASAVSRGAAAAGLRGSGAWVAPPTSPGCSWQQGGSMSGITGGASHLQAASRPSSRGSWCGGSVASASTVGAGGSTRCRVGGSGSQGVGAAGGAGSPSRGGRGAGVHWNPLYDPAALMVLPGSAAGEGLE